MAHALIVDDDRATRKALSELVRLQGFTTDDAGSLAEARERMGATAADVVLIDLVLPDGRGLDLLDQLETGVRPEIVLITGHATVESAVEALRRGVLDYLAKPVDVPRLKGLLAHVARTLELKQEVGELRGELRRLGRFGRMIGGSSAMQRAYDLIQKVAPSNVNVLITGESGTGKELVAHTLHELGPRKDGPFIAVNCGAIPSTLIESELFGHEKGSFTGATQRHLGFFERAADGTLFLDEITEMSPDLQSRLLRVLESGTLHRIGGEESISVNARVIAATNRVPAEAVQEKRLREDLYYRLNVFPIPMPPLRDRGQDVDLITNYFLEVLNKQAGGAKTLGADARAALARHSWPGNVRELWNALQRAYLMAGEVIDAESLPLDSARAATSSNGESETRLPVGVTLEEVERRMIMATLDRCAGDKRRAAEMLGISLKTLYNRLNVYAGPQRESV